MNFIFNSFFKLTLSIYLLENLRHPKNLLYLVLMQSLKQLRNSG